MKKSPRGDWVIFMSVGLQPCKASEYRFAQANGERAGSVTNQLNQFVMRVAPANNLRSTRIGVQFPLTILRVVVPDDVPEDAAVGFDDFGVIADAQGEVNEAHEFTHSW